MWQITFVASPKVLPELEHNLKVDERVLRHLCMRKQPFGPMPSTHAVKERVLRNLATTPS